uniref:Chromosome 1 open reading frame 115 n=5 Tax=Macaca TaxID=9539 RepID=A0A7N9CJW7_MACFA
MQGGAGGAHPPPGRPVRSGVAAIPGPTARGAAAPNPPPRPGWGGGAGGEQRLVSLRSDLRQRGRGMMTVGARLRSKAESSLLRRGPRGRGRTEGDEEAAAILEHLEYADEAEAAAESGASAAVERGPGARGARRVHFAHLPERYEPLEEPAPSEQPKKRYRRKLKKYGKNVGKVIIKGCRYVVIGLQGFAAAYSAPFAVATSVVSFVR